MLLPAMGENLGGKVPFWSLLLQVSEWLHSHGGQQDSSVWRCCHLTQQSKARCGAVDFFFLLKNITWVEQDSEHVLLLLLFLFQSPQLEPHGPFHSFPVS